MLDALETVDLSKDVYYRIKNEREEKWEEEILTVEQIQKRLSEQAETLEKLENRTEQVQERLDDARATAGEIEDAAEVAQKVPILESEVEDLRQFVDELALEADFDPPSSNVEIGDIVKWINELEQENLPERMDVAEDRIEENKNRSQRALNKAKKAADRIPETIWDLI